MAKQSFQEYVASVNASAFMFDEPTAADNRPNSSAKKSLGAKAKKLLEQIQGLNGIQAELLLGLVSGEWALVSAEKEHFAVQKDSISWAIIGLDPEAEEHHVNLELTACSCEDCRFRGRTCKHIIALKGIHR